MPALSHLGNSLFATYNKAAFKLQTARVQASKTVISSALLTVRDFYEDLMRVCCTKIKRFDVYRIPAKREVGRKDCVNGDSCATEILI